jgi:protease-4
MSMTADQIVDRRRLRRKLSFWRVVGFLAVLILLAGAILAATGAGPFRGVREAQIARITVGGFIGTDHRQVAMIKDIADSDAVKGVIVAIDSSGGSTTGGEELYDSLRTLAQKKPTVAAIGTIGASAAYMAALATDHIVSRRTTLTGSIGVLVEYPEVSALLDKIGVRVEEEKSTPLKGEPNPLHPASEETRQMLRAVIADTYNWFVDILAERRQIDRAAALALADGRIFTGRQALDAKLVDENGGEDVAVAWLGTKGVDVKLPIRDWEPSRDRGFNVSLSQAALLWIANQFGLSTDIFKGNALDRILPENLWLDGLRSVWQASTFGDR